MAVSCRLREAERGAEAERLPQPHEIGLLARRQLCDPLLAERLAIPHHAHLAEAHVREIADRTAARSKAREQTQGGA